MLGHAVACKAASEDMQFDSSLRPPIRSCMRVCKTCEEEYEDFGQRRSICRPCKRIYDRQFHANRTPEQIRRKVELQKIRIQENRKRVWYYLLEHPCENCPESDPVVLEFDHIDQKTKVAAVAEMMCLKWEKIEQEIAKCRVLCANCHRRHTAKQLGWTTF